MTEIRLAAVMLVVLGITGCKHRTVIRDTNTYRAEIDQYDTWAVQQAKYLRGFIAEHCECGGAPEGDPFKTDECEKAADFVLTIEARHAWHRDMALWNARLISEEPAKQPPEIPALACPLPAAQ